MATKPPKISRIPRVSKGELVPLFCGMAKLVLDNPMVPEGSQCPGTHRLYSQRIGDLGPNQGEARILSCTLHRDLEQREQVLVADAPSLVNWERMALTEHNRRWRERANNERVANPLWQVCSLPYGHNEPHVWEQEAATDRPQRG